MGNVLGNSSSEEPASSEPELPKHNTSDPQALKQALDEAAFKCLLDAEYTENHFYSNIKILIMVTAIAVSLLAQFAPVSFPENRPILGICALVYFALNGLLFYWIAAVEGDNLAFFHPKKVSAGVTLRTALPRFTEFYSVTIEQLSKEKPFKVEKTWSVGEWFDKEGHFDEEGFTTEVGTLVKSFESQKKD